MIGKLPVKEGGLGDVLFFYLPRFSPRMTELKQLGAVFRCGGVSQGSRPAIMHNLVSYAATHANGCNARSRHTTASQRAARLARAAVVSRAFD